MLRIIYSPLIVELALTLVVTATFFVMETLIWLNVLSRPLERRTRCSYFFNRIDYYDEERVGHSEQHPDVNHLNVACAWQIP